jgi:hypothetical protein
MLIDLPAVNAHDQLAVDLKKTMINDCASILR